MLVLAQSPSAFNSKSVVDGTVQTKVVLGTPRKSSNKPSAGSGLTVQALAPAFVPERSGSDTVPKSAKSLPVSGPRSLPASNDIQLEEPSILVFEPADELPLPRSDTKSNGLNSGEPLLDDKTREEVKLDLQKTLIPITTKLEDYTVNTLSRHRDQTFLPGLNRQPLNQQQTLDMSLYSSFRGKCSRCKR